MGQVHLTIHECDLLFAKSYSPALAELPYKGLFHYLRFTLSAAWDKRFSHSHFDGHITIPWFELDKRFKRGGFKAINDEVGFFEFTEYSISEAYTRGYRLTEHGRSFTEALTNAGYRGDLDLSTPMLNEDGKAQRKRRNGLHSRDMNGNTVKSTCILPSACPVDVKFIHYAMEQLQAWSDFYHGYRPEPTTYGPFEKLKRVEAKNRRDWILLRRQYLYHLYGEAHSHSLPYGMVRTEYQESQAGRLYAAHDMHLQNAPREIRKIALDGMHDYDFSNCHFAILEQLAHRYGIDCPAITDYLAHKKVVRATLSHNLDIPPDDVKTCLISLVYGAMASVWHKSAIPHTLRYCGGAEKAKKLYRHPLFRDLMREVRIVGKVVIANADSTDKGIVNAMGKLISRKEGWRTILAHLLQGVESQMLNVVVNMYQEEVLLVQHDGWTADRELDIPKMEAAILRDTDFKMTIEHERLFSGYF